MTYPVCVCALRVSFSHRFRLLYSVSVCVALLLLLFSLTACVTNRYGLQVLKCARWQKFNWLFANLNAAFCSPSPSLSLALFVLYFIPKTFSFNINFIFIIILCVWVHSLLPWLLFVVTAYIHWVSFHLTRNRSDICIWHLIWYTFI